MTEVKWSTRIDWTEAQKKLDYLRENLLRFEVPSAEEIALFKLSCLTYGQIPTDFLDRVASTDYVHVFDDERLGRLRDLAWHVGFTDEDDCDGAEDRHFRKGHWRVVRDAIKGRRITSAFIESWAHLHYYYGVYIELFLAHDQSHEEFKRAVKGLRKSAEIQRHWYANWIYGHAPDLSKDKRSDAEIRLAELCLEIARGRLAPALPYPFEWYVQMLERTKDGYTGQLTSGYAKISAREIKRMIQHPLLTPERLPPLTREMFKPEIPDPQGWEDQARARGYTSSQMRISRMMRGEDRCFDTIATLLASAVTSS